MTTPQADPAEGPFVRVFFAFWPDARLASDLDALGRRCAEVCGGRAMRRETLHLTLVFVGAVPEAKLTELVAVAEPLPPSLELTVDRVGYWPHNRIVWAGGEAPAVLSDFAAGLAGRVRAAGFPAERRPFVPHVTLRRNARCGADALAAASAGTSLVWPLNELRLVRSGLGPDGARYEPVHRWPLKPAD